MTAATFTTVADLLARAASKAAPRILAAEPAIPSAFAPLDLGQIARDIRAIGEPECEPDRAVRLIAEAGLAVYSASVQLDMLPQSNRIAEAVRLIAEAYRLIEDAEAFARDDRNMVPE